MPDAKFLRAFPTVLEQKGPRLLTGRLVPYDTATDVLDYVDGRPDVYREGFRLGSFARQAGSKERGVFGRIGLVHKHDGGLGYLGPFVALREAPDGLYGDAEVLRSKASDVEDLLSAGVSELSVEFRLVGKEHTRTDAAGVRWRTHAHLDAVAMEPKGAYSGAQVLAFREEADELAKEAAAVDAAKAAEEEAERLAMERAAAEQAGLEALAEEVLSRRDRFAAMAARLDQEMATQQRYVRDYGLTVPPHPDWAHLPY